MWSQGGLQPRAPGKATGRGWLIHGRVQATSVPRRSQYEAFATLRAQKKTEAETETDRQTGLKRAHDQGRQVFKTERGAVLFF